MNRIAQGSGTAEATLATAIYYVTFIQADHLHNLKLTGFRLLFLLILVSTNFVPEENANCTIALLKFYFLQPPEELKQALILPEYL